MKGELGRAVVKISAVDNSHRSITAPAQVFESQDDFKRAFNDGELEKDFVAVLTHQGPAEIVMTELHKLTPYLGLLQNRGFKVALLTDGRMSGASGKVLAAIQVTPEAANGGALARIRDGDRIAIDAVNGVLSVVDDVALDERETPFVDDDSRSGMGRELFAAFRERATGAEQGASLFGTRRN